MQLFHELGSSIEDHWRQQNYDEALFPALAADALRTADVSSKLGGWDVMEWALQQSELPHQKDVSATFGDPPITVYAAPRFYIDVYFWLEGTTATHQHGFCGAFQVLMGSSIHSWYGFQRREAVNIFTELGVIDLKVCELLEVGSVQEIRAGREYIHSLFHLDQPSATIVVRTDKSPLHLPQYSYYKPCLAVDPFYEDDTTTKKLQCVRSMMRANYSGADELILRLLKTSDFQTTIQILSTAHGFSHANRIDEMFKLSAPKDRFQRFLDAAVERHGDRAAQLKDVFAARDRLNQIVAQRSYVTKPEHRFFLALLLNVDGRRRIFSLIQQRYPDADPLGKALDWIYELSQTRVVGSTLPNALNIVDFNDTDIAILEAVFNGNDDPATFARIVEQGSALNESAFAARLATLRAAPVLQPLLVD